ncbi:MAG: YggS family pyridoxal phosphate-dependent enzyme [Acidaminococcaceae bacterium]
MFSENLEIVQTRINNALAMRKETKKTGEKVTLVAVTKNHPADVILASMALGISDIGENRVQEAKQKKAVVPNGPKWHLLGHLQTNKVKQAVEIFDIIESVDSEKILDAINKTAQQQGKVQEILLQLNIAGEEQKSGFDKESYEAIVPKIREFKNVSVRGIMVIAQKCEDVEETRLVFRKGYEKFCELREYLGDMHVDILSMGMTHDYWIAVEEGANSVRIGTALFGERDYGR